MSRRALLLDRDGVINVDKGHVCRTEDFELIPGVTDLCRHAVKHGYLLIVVTNQAGIGRGYYSEDSFLSFTEWMCEGFRERGLPIARVYYCPFHPEFGVGRYKRDSDCRKPAPGMILRAADDFGLNLKHSVLVGDNETDVLAGVAAGVGCNVLYCPNIASRNSPTATLASHVVTRLADVTPLLGDSSDQ